MLLPPYLMRTNVRVCVAFWLLGLINNVLYVIILSAALDLVGPSTPKGLVLLADVLPSFLTKLTAPYYIHLFTYSTRVAALVLLSACGMLVIALSPPSKDAAATVVKLSGVALASVSSGAGELSFLGLTHFYGHRSLASWSSGTGGAGLVGAGAYVLATNTLGLSSRTSLIAFAFLPLIMLLSFFVILPSYETAGDYQSISTGEDDLIETEEQSALSSSVLAERDSELQHKQAQSWVLFKANLNRAKSLFLPYMLPLLLVYIAEYTINQGVAPTILFPLSSSPFSHYRDFYPVYGFVYQIGVFISRSSVSFFRIHHLYAPSLLQFVNLGLLIAHAMFDFLPNVWVVCIIIFWEGLLGGLVYVSTFAEIIDNIPEHEREFSLSATTVSDSGGICIAALVSMVLEKGLCNWQVARGRDYCLQL